MIVLLIHYVMFYEYVGTCRNEIKPMVMIIFPLAQHSLLSQSIVEYISGFCQEIN